MSLTYATAEDALRGAVRTALAAPSIFNTQPWQWRLDPPRARLYADRSRQLLVADPSGRLLTVSCGAALHHARTVLAAGGMIVDTVRLPDPADPDLLAELTVDGRGEADLDHLLAAGAIRRRRTDRRPFSTRPVPEAVCRGLMLAAAREGAHAVAVGRDHIAVFALAAVRASATQLSDPDYRAELADWTHRPPWSGDGVDASGAVRAVPRRVPVRDFAPFGGAGLLPGREDDRGARYLLIHTDTDTPLDWIRAGEALSAVLLAAVSVGLATAPVSDVTELAATRDQLRELLPGLGHPQVAVRIGYPPQGEPPPRTVRRLPEEVIDPRGR
ncbi:NAD(P)H nitroreductase [Catellatospora sp. TT07R-123]|uniref:Acg family FMN-binding oxidoreductase n=1 Tax=Catellatospora sp. TT07R-123 TaxID=2733863 RepID=UPI001B189C48|nr:nitroreductase family protein [Catellatospora sp. TT07R-123]GHJ43900.1 NAD(P)H nitroreductase [Catellatospora sp. TT07R-123]